MLHEINLKNFRAYKSQKFDFSKINIFMGPNNSGKSSIISAINLIAQTVQNRALGSSVLLLNGPHEELGTYIDAVHGNNSRTSMGLDFKFNKLQVGLEYKYRTQRREISLNKFTLTRDRKPLYSYQANKNGYDIKFGRKSVEQINPRKSKKAPLFFGFWPQDRNLFYLGDRHTNLPKGLKDAARSLRMGDRLLIDQFRNFDTLSPFRDQPQRTYHYTGEAPHNVGRTGSNGVSLLVGDVSKRGASKLGILKEINKFFQETGIAKGLAVENLTPRHFELCVIDFAGKKHNICDSGFGCSQVLPVLVSGLNLFLRSQAQRPHTRPMPGSQIFVVQEPEIHLHPNAQAALGSFFAGLAASPGQMFIETHSDHLVLRLARHVVRGDLSPDDIRIYYVEDIEGRKKVRLMKFDENGTFSPDWPGGFLPYRKEAALELARERSRKIGLSKSDERFNYI